MKSFLTRIKNYALRTESYSIPRVIGEFVLLDLVATFLVQIAAFLFITFFIAFPLLIINPSFDINSLLNFLNFNQEIITEATSGSDMAGAAIFFAVCVAPLLETAIFQAFPVWLTSFFTKKRILLVLASTIIFSLAHVYPLLIIYIFPGGLILAWTYVMLRKKVGWGKAFLTTALIHGIFNAINLLGALLLGY